MDRPKVSVVIPTYNRAYWVTEALESALKQTVPPSQVIVVNDGSTDNTREVLEPYRSRIEYLEQPNSGKARALNLGLARVTGDYVWMLDDDDMAFPELLERHLKVLEADKEIGFTYSGRVDVRSRAGDKAFEVIGLRDVPDVPEDEVLPRLMEGDFMLFQGAVMRTACLRQVGPFDERLRLCEDYDMAIRLVRTFRCAHVSGPTFYFRRHTGVRGSAKDPITQEAYRKRQQVFFNAIFLPLRKELSLRDYLPRPLNGKQLELVDERRACLQRMGIMASKGLLEEMLEDIRLALGDGSDRRPLSSAEQRSAWIAMGTNDHDDILYAGPQFLQRIRALCKGEVGHQLHYEFTRGLFWRFLRALRDGEYSFALRLVRCAWWFVGLRKAASFTWEWSKGKIVLPRRRED